MAKGKKATAEQKTSMKARLTEMKNAAGGSKDKLKHDAAIAEGATFEEKIELVREARLIEPTLPVHAAADVAEEYYDEETGDREATKRAAWVIADEDPRDAPEFPADPPGKLAKEYEDPPDPTPVAPVKGEE